MPDLLPPTKEFKYLIRPDGSIRVRTTAQIQPEETDFVYMSKTKYQPGKYFWDFTSEQMLAYSPAQRNARKQAVQAAAATAEIEKVLKVAEIKRLVARGRVKELQEAFHVLGDLLGYDFGP